MFCPTKFQVNFDEVVLSANFGYGMDLIAALVKGNNQKDVFEEADVRKGVHDAILFMNKRDFSVW